VFKVATLILVLLLITAGGLFLYSKSNEGKKRSETRSTLTFSSPSFSSSTNSDELPLLLKNIGVNLDYYDPKTGKAGDFTFTKEKLQFGRMFMGFGFVIPASSASSGKDKSNPQPTFIVPLGTPVRSLVDGVVAAMPKVWSGDYSIQVSANGKLEKWMYETEHVINPLVKPGDIVKAGQIIAEVSPHSKENNAGYGLVEIGLLKGGNSPQHICPFAYLDPSVKNEIQNKLLALYKSWEEYHGDINLHDEIAQKVPGCLTLGAIEG